MTDEMIRIAHSLHDEARKYLLLHEKQNAKKPVVWIKNKETGEGVFITDSFNTDIFISMLNKRNGVNYV